MNKDYTYSAFISYSSKDEKVAKSLWKKLERYRLPAVLQKQHEDIPSKMHVFLDQGDIVPGDTVENALCRELADSKKLIVICSPNSAYSKYVELEVSNFKKLGHSDNDIIPYIIDGEVDKNSPNNCYVPSLFGKDDKDTLNGVSVIRDGKWKAFVGVLANLLDLKFDEIYKREKIRKRKLLIYKIIVLIFLFLCVLAVYFKKFHVYHRYFVDYVEKAVEKTNGTDIEFIGLGKLSKKDIKKRMRHYKFDYKDGKLRKIVYENSFGIPKPIELLEYKDRPMIQEMEYNETTGYLQAILSKNEYDSVLTRFVYEQKGTVIDLKNTDGSPVGLNAYTNHYFYNFDTTMIGYSSFNQKSNIKSIKIERDENGYIIKKMYFRVNGAEYPAKDSEEVAGFEYVLDDLGRPIQVWYLGIRKNEFERQSSKIGVAGYFLEYDNNYNIYKNIYVDSIGKAINLLGISQHIYDYDKNGNLVKESFKDKDGVPCLEANGIAYVINSYDEFGNLSEAAIYNTDNELSYNKDLYAIERHEYDRNGNIIVTKLYDINNELCMSKAGYSIAQIKYNLENQPIEICYFDHTKHPTLCNGEYAKIILTYNKNGDIETVCCFNEKNQPCYINKVFTEYGYQYTDGFSKQKMIYDENHRIKEQHFYDIDLVTPKRINNQIASVLYEYDKTGNIIEINFFDETGKPVSDTIFSTKQKFDDAGHLLEQFYYDDNGANQITSEGYSGIGYTYDEFGNLKTIAYYKDLEKHLINLQNGFAYAEYEYDDRGNNICLKIFDSSKRPIAPYCIVRNDFDINNNIIKISYYNDKNELTKCEEGYAQTCFEYNEAGKITKQSFFDEFGNYVLWNNQYAIQTTKYDIYGRDIEHASYDVDEKLNNYLYPFSIERHKYDLVGNTIEVSYYKNESELVCCKEGYAIFRSEYDKHRNRIKEEYFDENEKLLYKLINFANSYIKDNDYFINEKWYQENDVFEYNKIDKIEYFYDNNELIKEIVYYNDYGSQRILNFELGEIVHQIVLDGYYGDIREFFYQKEKICHEIYTYKSSKYEDDKLVNALLEYDNINSEEEILLDIFYSKINRIERFFENDLLVCEKLYYENNNITESFYKNNKLIHGIISYNNGKIEVFCENEKLIHEIIMQEDGMLLDNKYIHGKELKKEKRILGPKTIRDIFK